MNPIPSYLILCRYIDSQKIEACINWPIFCKQIRETYFSEGNLLYFDTSFRDFCFKIEPSIGRHWIGQWLVATGDSPLSEQTLIKIH